MLTRGTVTLRPARAAEATAIALLSRLHVERGLRWRWTPTRVKRSIADAETIVLVATVGDDIAGFGIMYFGDVDAHLQLLAVEARHRRRGIGGRIMRWFEELCRTAGMRHIRLEVRSENAPARHFYEHLGYELFEEIPGYYDRLETALVFRKSPGT